MGLHLLNTIFSALSPVPLPVKQRRKIKRIPPEAVGSPELYLFHVNYILLVFSQVAHKRHAADTGMGMGRAGKRQKREGEERWVDVSLSLVEAGDWVLCHGLSRSCFLPLDFISSSASPWCSGTCDPKLFLEGGWRG